MNTARRNNGAPFRLPAAPPANPAVMTPRTDAAVAAMLAPVSFRDEFKRGNRAANRFARLCPYGSVGSARCAERDGSGGQGKANHVFHT